MSLLSPRNLYRRLLPATFRIRFRDFRRRLGYLRSLDKNVIFMSKRLRQFSGAYRGHHCFIMGNGPSLNKMDLKLFGNEFVWGSNRCYLLFDRIPWRPKFYVAVDKRVVPDNANEINLLSKKMPDSYFFYPADFRRNRILKSNENVYWYDEVPHTEANLPYSMFSTAPSNFVYTVRSVTIAMLQLAVYLGFNPIYLIGCDTNYRIPPNVQIEKGDSNLLISTDSDPNHFDPSYFGAGKKWHDPHVDGMIFHYEQAKKVCDEQGIRVLNATVGGNLEVFPRVNYLELF